MYPSVVVCPQCGYDGVRGRFCGKCGHDLSDVQDMPTAAPAAAAAAVPVKVNSKPVPGQEGKGD